MITIVLGLNFRDLSFDFSSGFFTIRDFQLGL
jgi:hypothetical protein